MNFFPLWNLCTELNNWMSAQRKNINVIIIYICDNQDMWIRGSCTMVYNNTLRIFLMWTFSEFLLTCTQMPWRNRIVCFTTHAFNTLRKLVKVFLSSSNVIFIEKFWLFKWILRINFINPHYMGVASWAMRGKSACLRIPVGYCLSHDKWFSFEMKKYL